MNNQESKNTPKIDRKITRRRKRPDSYSNYIYKILKELHTDTSISSKAMDVMNSFVKDLFERLVNESADLAKFHNNKALTKREIEASVNLLMPGEMAINAVNEGNKAISKYISSESDQDKDLNK